jgi:hypothetical protein
MNYGEVQKIDCSRFEESMTDYLDKTLDGQMQKGMAEHAMKCPLCHSLLNEVKESLQLCHELAEPKASMTRLEARVLSMTMPETAMHCSEFEDHLTDYMDGFLPASLFHRWERHAVLCNTCTDLPGMVVRSIAACYTYKMEELEVPEGLNSRILKATIGTVKASEIKASWVSQVAEWARGLKIPMPIPQLAPVAMMFILAFLVFSQTVSADGSLSGVYAKSVELAEQTYKQSADVWGGNTVDPNAKKDAVSGTTNVDQEDKK